jgi:GNAT superfamily N-acetyltransferase
MPIRMTIRPATVADVPQILTFIRALADYERLLSAVVATEEGLRAALFGPRPYAEVVLAEADGAPVGFALFFHTFSTFLGQPGIYLEDLFVVPEARGRGVGRALLAHLARLAGARGCGRVEWAVLDWNAPAIRFYESLGAQPNSEWTVYRLTGDPLATLAASPE